MVPDGLTPVIANPPRALRRQQPEFYNNLLMTTLAVPPFRQLHWPNPQRRTDSRVWLAPPPQWYRIPELPPVNVGFPPAPLADRAPAFLADAASVRWARQIAEAANNMLRGKLNATAALTLRANAATTTITDVRISAFSAILFSPLTADAAAEMAAGTLYVSSQMSGQAVISHANNAQSDRSFRLLIIG